MTSIANTAAPLFATNASLLTSFLELFFCTGNQDFTAGTSRDLRPVQLFARFSLCFRSGRRAKKLPHFDCVRLSPVLIICGVKYSCIARASSVHVPVSRVGRIVRKSSAEKEVRIATTIIFNFIFY